MEAGSAEHLPFEHLDAVDVSFDNASSEVSVEPVLLAQAGGGPRTPGLTAGAHLPSIWYRSASRTPPSSVSEPCSRSREMPPSG